MDSAILNDVTIEKQERRCKMCMREESSLSFSLAHVALNGFPLSVMSSICYYSHAVLFCSSETSSPAGNVRLTEQRRTGRRQCIDSIRVKHQWSSMQLASNLVSALLTSPFLLPPSLPTPPHRVLCQTHSSPTPTHAASSQTLRTLNAFFCSSSSGAGVGLSGMLFLGVQAKETACARSGAFSATAQGRVGRSQSSSHVA